MPINCIDASSYLVDKGTARSKRECAVRRAPTASKLWLAAWAAAVATCTACTPISSDYAYSTTVRLSNGKMVACDVNEEPASTTPASNGLTLTEERQAEVLATQRLRVLTGPYSEYPTPYTAPIVHCRPAT